MSTQDLVGYSGSVNRSLKFRAKRRLGKLATQVLLKTGSSGLLEVGANEAVNFASSAIFVAVPKTGTTSIRGQMTEKRPFLIPTPHLDICEIRKAIEFYYLIQSLERNHCFPTDDTNVASHSQVVDDATAFFEGCFKFGSVRNPWARTVSIYSRREGVMPSPEMNFADFCKRLKYASDTCEKPSLHRNQVDWFLDERGNLGVDHIIKLEERSVDLDKIREMTRGRIDLQNTEKNRNPESHSREYRDFYDDDSKAIIGKLFEKDIDILKYVF